MFKKLLFWLAFTASVFVVISLGTYFIASLFPEEFLARADKLVRLGTSISCGAGAVFGYCAVQLKFRPGWLVVMIVSVSFGIAVLVTANNLRELREQLGVPVQLDLPLPPLDVPQPVRPESPVVRPTATALPVA